MDGVLWVDPVLLDIFFFIKVGQPRSRTVSFFDHLRSIYFNFSKIYFLKYCKMVPPVEEDWFEPPLASHRIVVISSSLRRKSLSFLQLISTKENETILYQSPPGFKPTTFLIHDLSNWRIRPLDHRGSTTPWYCWLKIF